jgi:hypothetical protein
MRRLLSRVLILVTPWTAIMPTATASVERVRNSPRRQSCLVRLQPKLHRNRAVARATKHNAGGVIKAHRGSRREGVASFGYANDEDMDVEATPDGDER